MTRKQLRHKFAELKRNHSKAMDELLEKSIQSGAIDLPSAEDNFIMPRIVFAACLKAQAHQLDLHRIDHQKEADNLYLFL